VKNRIALTLSMATMAFGLFWLVWILMSTITRGLMAMSGAVYRNDAAAEHGGWWLANALAGSAC
jgi:phosphate transport system permease protein